MTTSLVGLAGRHRLLVDGATSHRGHRDWHGALPDVTGAEIRRMVAEAGLAGRGGAGFPTHRKLDAVAAGSDAIVIGNASEGEPASDKDRALLAYAPHLVLDGLVLAARAVNARRAHLYVPESAVDAVHTSLLSRNDPVHITVHVAPDAFVVGEESAVVAAISGGHAAPRDKVVRILDKGLFGKPTLVQNIETLAHLALIARYGPAWFRTQGTPDEPGTFLATVSGAVQRPGVYELPYGARLHELIDSAGGVDGRIQAVLVGGYHGAWIPADPNIEISRSGLAPYQATPGAGVAVALSAHQCGLETTADIVTYLAEQSAGQCGPCLNGLPRLAQAFRALASGNADAAQAAQISRLSGLVDGRGACKHPDGTVRLVRSALRLFAGDVKAHLDRWCIPKGGRS